MYDARSSGAVAGLPDSLRALREFDTCTIANAIERFGVRLRNEGFTRPGLTCVTGEATLLGYAATCRVRSANPPMTGNRFLERTDWWSAIETLPAPRIAVIEDLDAEAGWASCVGEVHAAILQAFACQGVITNGAVRDVPAARNLGFPMFARAIAVSHGYSHMVDFGGPVDIFGLRIHSGDLLLADCHGVVSIPKQIAAELPPAAESIRRHEQRIVQVCQEKEFSPERLRRAIEDTD